MPGGWMSLRSDTLGVLSWWPEGVIVSASVAGLPMPTSCLAVRQASSYRTGQGVERRLMIDRFATVDGVELVVIDLDPSLDLAGLQRRAAMASLLAGQTWVLLPHGHQPQLYRAGEQVPGPFESSDLCVFTDELAQARARLQMARST
jgi:hypothetical protein